MELGVKYQKLSRVVQRTVGKLTQEETVELAKLVVRELDEEGRLAVHDYIDVLDE